MYTFHHGCPPQRSLLGVQVALYTCFPLPNPTIPRIWPTISGRAISFFFFFFFLPGLRSRSRDRSWSRPASTVLAGVGVGAGLGKFCQLRLRPGVAGCQHQQTIIMVERVCIVLRTLLDRPIGEWQCGDKVIASFSDGIRSDRLSEIVYGHRYRRVTVSTIPDCHTFLHSKTSTASTAGCIRH